MSNRTAGGLIALGLVAALISGGARLGAQSGAKNGEWRSWGADPGSSHYSALDQINADNVKNLKIVWRFKTENLGPRPDYGYRNTPLMVGGALYTTAGTRRDIVALDAVTGETLWVHRFDEGVRGARAANRGPSGRGVAYWTDGRGDERIVYVSLGYRLVELNAKTGNPIPTFGKDGVVDLYQGLDQEGKPPVQDGQLGNTSPPAILNDVVIVGASLGGSPNKEFIAGFPRGFDVRTGKQVWVFHTIPQPGEFGNDTWLKDSWAYTGHTGVWAPITVDEELGYVYLGVETPTNDFYGGHRPGNGLFGDSIVCVDFKTGKRVWHYQLSHHEIWDYDIPAASNLVDITVDGRRIKALAQVTKQGFTFVFDRVTGQPVWPIVEKPVPQSDVPGEATSLTQPFPTKPAPFERQGVTADDLIDLTPALKARALEFVKDYRMGPLYTPSAIVGSATGKKGTLMLPSANGGASWQGAAVDPDTGVLYIPSTTNIWIHGLTKRDQGTTAYASGGAGLGPTAAMIDNIPIVKPPWGRITAVDLNTGNNLWVVPNGPAPEYIQNNPLLKGVDLSNAGSGDNAGLLVTKTLLFAGQGAGVQGVPKGAGGKLFRALDKKTGAVIWQMQLPGRQSGMPMTYMVNGKQYIIVAISGENIPAELVALALP
jgi:quinoprotein glucose dehydrogenase